jgi:hypothetical protein
MGERDVSTEIGRAALMPRRSDVQSIGEFTPSASHFSGNTDRPWVKHSFLNGL